MTERRVTLPGVNLPSVSLPSVSLPSVSLHWALSIHAQPRSLEPSRVGRLIASLLPELRQVFSHTWQPRSDEEPMVEAEGLSLFGSCPELTLVLHTWPEHSSGSLDLFFCEAFDAGQLVRALSRDSGWRVVLAQESKR